MTQSMFPTAMASVSWSATEPDRWELRTITPEGALSALVSVWPTPYPPSLLERYDALAAIGFAVVEGGADAWTWRETLDDDGALLLVGGAGIRPVVAQALSVDG
ncbi:hypothetical protein [Streptomyces sp. bgisy091]|uniref:hypothetical protein n=1 Tax=Streptomyces sp. bgisy091 TaxID=3413778 RepID=UPI003D743AA3